jgi:spore coat polysaccharide biosynthesis protein SpsF
MKILTVIQARRGSTRLPDKVMMPVLGDPILLKMIERVKRSKLHGQLCVATTLEEKDDAIEEICKTHNIDLYRGNSSDLLDRHYQAAVLFGADAVVKIPSDCPLIDPNIIDKVLQHYISHSSKYDFVSNLHPASWPDGNDVEVMSFTTLEKAWKEAKRPLEREHTTPYIWENPDKFKIGSVLWETGFDFSTSHRWTLDYPEDFEFIKRVYEELYPKNPHFTLNDILQLLKENPAIAEINKTYAGDYWYKNHMDELKNVDDKWKKKDPNKN